MDTKKIKRIAAVFVLTLFAALLVLLATIKPSDNGTSNGSETGKDSNIHVVSPEPENSGSTGETEPQPEQDTETPVTQEPSVSPVSVTEEELPQSLKELAEQYSVVGMSVIVIENGQVSHAYSYGLRNKETGQEFNSETVMRVASISGLVSSVGVMNLVDDGILSLDESIGNYLGYTVVNPYNSKEITLRQILTHTAALSDYGTYDKITNGDMEYQTLKSMLNGDYAKSNFYELLPGYKFEYSNFGGAIIASVVSAATQQVFNDYIYDHIFAPLAIDAAYLSTAIVAQDNIATIYRQGSVSYSPDSMKAFSAKLLSIAPTDNYRCSHANLYISAKDLSRIARLFLGGGEVDGVRILSEDSVNEMLSTAAKGTLYSDVGYGLYVAEYDDLVNGRTLCGQQGGAYGATAEMFFDMSDKSGVILLVNGSSNAMLDNGISAMGSAIINEIYKSVIG